MNIMQCSVRIVVGAGVLWGADFLHHKAHEVSDTAIGVGETTRIVHEPISDEKRLPQPEDADFFGNDPRQTIKRPEVKARLKEAIDLDQLAILIALAGGGLVLLGVYPVVSGIGSWLFLPDWVRKRIDAANDSGEHKEKSHAGTRSTGTGDRGNGSDDIIDLQVHRMADAPPQTIASTEAPQRSDGPAADVVDGGRPVARA